MNFIAIDVETANNNIASICQVGLVRFIAGKTTNEQASILVNPSGSFDPHNVNIHGITECDVADAPTFDQAYEEIVWYMSGAICVSHTNFDRRAIENAIARYGLAPIQCEWLDSLMVARMVWKQRSRYDLKSLCRMIGHQFRHHDALEDAKACGYVLLAAVEQSGISIEEWLRRLK